MAQRAGEFWRKFRDRGTMPPDISSMWWILIPLVALLAICYYVRPWFHGIIMGLYKSPLVLMFLFAIFLLLVINLVMYYYISRVQFKDTAKYNTFQKVRRALTILVVIFMISLVPLYLYSGYYMDRTLYENTEYIELTTMPETDVIRFLPFSVAERYSLDAFTDPQYTIGDGDMVKQGGRLYWNFPMVPEGSILYFTKKPQGVISISADTSGKEISTQMAEMQIGENIGITDNIEWRIYKEDMFCDIADIYYQDDLIVVSVIKYKFKLIGRYPYFGGVYTIDFDGNINFFSPEEAAEQPWGNRVYPESLARKQVEVVNTRNGLLNMWIYHKEMIEIQDVYSGGNQQPFLLDTDDGLVWMTAVEPRGRSFGLYEIYFQGAVDGKIYVYRVSSENLTGPRYSIDYVKKTFPNFDWFSFYISEPRPIIKNGELYWLVSIVPNDSAGVTMQCVVKAKTSDVTSFASDAEVKAFFEDNEEGPTDEGITIEDIRDKIEEVEALLDELKALLEELESG
ncbi:MAG: hypothetical protein JW825_05140 [Candidatus Methanofastidiosa archaeon]|nr:hypothetical protein [Candidatus Methanofastidiosa archaeon]